MLSLQLFSLQRRHRERQSLQFLALTKPSESMSSFNRRNIMRAELVQASQSGQGREVTYLPVNGQVTVDPMTCAARYGLIHGAHHHHDGYQ
jgi:hypothetical protein